VLGKYCPNSARKHYQVTSISEVDEVVSETKEFARLKAHNKQRTGNVLSRYSTPSRYSIM
jgi:hypothetical protein